MIANRRTIPLLEYPARRIGLIKPSALGDIVHALPVLTALRRRYPAAHITWVVNAQYEPLLRGHPDLDAILPFDRSLVVAPPWHAVRGFWDFGRRLRAARFDLVVDLQGLLRSGLMAWISGAPRRVGLATAREGSRRFYTDVIDAADWKRLHAVERNWLAARALGAGDQPLRFHVPLDEQALAWAKETLVDCPRPWLCFGLGATRPTKRWPAEHFLALADRAQHIFGGTVLCVGRADVTPLAHRILARLTGSGMDLTGRTTLPQLAALLSRADVMVANDTGPLHLAAALGRPTVAPYTCTSVRRHGPHGNLDRAIETTVACRGSYRKRCGRLDCMSELTPDRLWPALDEVLESWQQVRQYA